MVVKVWDQIDIDTGLDSFFFSQEMDTETVKC